MSNEKLQRRADNVPMAYFNFYSILKDLESV